MNFTNEIQSRIITAYVEINQIRLRLIITENVSWDRFFILFCFSACIFYSLMSKVTKLYIALDKYASL